MTPEKYEKLRQNEPVLCYVDGGKAYFTTQKLEDQWGDDWDDAPYEHNAGIPTKPCWHREQRNCPCDICEREWDGLTPKWEIVEVVFEYSADRPSDLYNNRSSATRILKRNP